MNDYNNETDIKPFKEGSNAIDNELYMKMAALLEKKCNAIQKVSIICTFSSIMLVFAYIFKQLNTEFIGILKWNGIKGKNWWNFTPWILFSVDFWDIRDMLLSS